MLQFENAGIAERRKEHRRRSILRLLLSQEPEDPAGGQESWGEHIWNVISCLRESLAKALHFFGIILIFAIGAGVGGVLSNLFGIRTIWVSPILLMGVTLMMVKE